MSSQFQLFLFSVDEDNFGETTSFELKPNGASIVVTNDNKDEYIDLVIWRKLVSKVQNQVSLMNANMFLN